ncbi:hypothetical protein N776_12365 [Neisseria gonorrhoeae 3502]|uniref:Uncharacterized protein n=1 Tax=Neisseria gonorrhoeae 3502 TaxID=1193404 RepID=A0AA44UAM0_NEIGO|nr:hypothetical protein N776_12365 [Neisseria gonorrhoeae 3502]
MVFPVLRGGKNACMKRLAAVSRFQIILQV